MKKPGERVAVGLGGRAYEIAIGPGLMGQAPALIAKAVGDRPLVVVTDSNVADLHLPRLEAAFADTGAKWLPPVVVPAGEATKSFEGFAKTAERILGLGIDRRTVIVALGGGVVGDLAGFLAATLLRGIDFVQIPTTLLAQVDSSVGGKTGIDSRHGKNLIGAFHQPRLVIADTDALTTLPPRELRAGYAEIVKYGLLGDEPFFRWLEANGAAVLEGEEGALVHAIATSCRTKARIVEADEREADQRALLNLGHTFGHALEAKTGFGDALCHGEAVSIGMVLAFDLSVRLGYCPVADLMKVRAHLAHHGLPVAPPRGFDFEPSALVDVMQHDKKAERGRLTFVLVRGIGQAFIAKDVERSVVETALANALAA